jgi:predicted amidohydrolase
MNISQNNLIGLIQFDPVLGDIEGNKNKIISLCAEFTGRLSLLILPEMCLIGYGDDMMSYHKYGDNYLLDFLLGLNIADNYIAGGICYPYNSAINTFGPPINKYNLFSGDVGFISGSTLYNQIVIPNFGTACIAICNDFNNEMLIEEVVKHQPDYFIVIAAISYRRHNTLDIDWLKQINHWASTLNEYRGIFIACNQCETVNDFVGGSCIFKVKGGIPFIKSNPLRKGLSKNKGYGLSNDEIKANISQTLDTLEYIHNLESHPGVLMNLCKGEPL